MEKEEKKKRSLIFGGTRGFGLALAQESSRRGIMPIVIGRSAHAQGPHRDIPGVHVFTCDLRPFKPEVNLVSVPSPAIAEMLRSLGNAFGEITHVIWNAGTGLKGQHLKCTKGEVDNLIDLHLRAPMQILAVVHARMLANRSPSNVAGQPYHLIVIGSTTGWRNRSDEAVYGAVQAGKAQFVRDFGGEVITSLPGSKVTLVHPGGMKTGFHPPEVDTSLFINPNVVAERTWTRVLTQESVFSEITFPRREDGTPGFEVGPHTPELPF